EEVARYSEADARADANLAYATDRGNPGDNEDEAEEGDEAAAGPQAGHEAHAWQRLLRLTYAARFVLRTKADGWKLFCERMNVPPFLLWEGFPGFDRLRRTLNRAEKGECTSEGFIRWMNDVRPVGTPELTEVPLTVEGVASATEDVFRARVEWW